MQKGLIYFMAILMPFFVYGDKNEGKSVVPAAQGQLEQKKENYLRESAEFKQNKIIQRISHGSLLNFIGGSMMGGGALSGNLMVASAGVALAAGGIILCEFQFSKLKNNFKNIK